MAIAVVSPGVEDSDDGGCSSPSSTAHQDDLRERLSAMLAQEPRYLCRNYLRNASQAATKRGAARRSTVVRWLFDGVASLGLRRETAAVAASYLDRYLSSASPRGKRARNDCHDYQLAAMTCLYLAVKIHEPVRLDASALSGLAVGVVSAEDITACEQDILASLRWRVQGPTPLEFARYILELLPDGSVTPEVARWLHMELQRQTELAVEDYACVILKRSTIAIAAVLNALEGVSEVDWSLDERSRFVRTMADAFCVDVDSPLIQVARKRLHHRSVWSIVRFL